jgi:hypothetical protein
MDSILKADILVKILGCHGNNILVAIATVQIVAQKCLPEADLKNTVIA